MTMARQEALQEAGARTQVEARGAPVVCVVSPRRGAYSETFVRAHIERLPTRVEVLYGGAFPFRVANGAPLLPPPSPPIRLAQGALRRLAGWPWYRYEQRALVRFLRSRRVAVVLAEFGPTGLSLVDACREAGVPLAVYFHGFDAYKRETLEEVGGRYPHLFRSAAAVIAVSREMVDQLQRLGAPLAKVHYNPCGADTDLFQGADPGAAPAHFVGVGRFVDMKAPQLTLLAFAKARQRAPHAELTLIGDGPLWECCQRLAGALGIAEAVRLPGVVSHDEVAEAMRSARAFVQHSVRTFQDEVEGTPVAVLEAGAMGLPVIATRHAGIRDVVIDGEMGALVDEGDVDGMAAAMVRLAEDPELARDWGRAARARVVAEFSMERSIGHLWEILVAIARKE